MPLLVETWKTRANVPLADTSTVALQAKSVMFAIKSALMDQASGGTTGTGGAPAAGWVQTGSSDGTTAGMDATDRWGSTFDGSKIVRGTGGAARSWISMRNATSTLYMCMSYDTANDYACRFAFSQTAFSGGTTTARPTASNEFFAGAATATDVTLVNTAASAAGKFGYSVDTLGMWNFWTSKDGSGITTLGMFVRKLADTLPSDLATYVVFFKAYSEIGRGSPVSINAVNALQGRTFDNTANLTAGGLACITAAGGATVAGGSGMGVNLGNSKWDGFECYSISTVALKSGVRGRIPDFWASVSTPVATAEPSTGDPELIVMGEAWIPCSVALSL